MILLGHKQVLLEPYRPEAGKQIGRERQVAVAVRGDLEAALALGRDAVQRVRTVFVISVLLA